MSCGVHILGVFVGYMGWHARRQTTNEKRRNYVDFDVDTKNLLPCFTKAK